MPYLIVTYWRGLSLISPRKSDPKRIQMTSSLSLIAWRQCLLVALHRGRPRRQTVMKIANAPFNRRQHEWQRCSAPARQKRVADNGEDEIYGEPVGAIRAWSTERGSARSIFITRPRPAYRRPAAFTDTTGGMFVSLRDTSTRHSRPGAYRDRLETMFHRPRHPG